MMADLFYGLSNVYWNYSWSSLGSDLGLTLVDCTRKSVFDAHISVAGSLGSNNLVISSVLENFFSEVCHGLCVSEVSLFANQAITSCGGSCCSHSRQLWIHRIHHASPWSTCSRWVMWYSMKLKDRKMIVRLYFVWLLLPTSVVSLFDWAPL